MHMKTLLIGALSLGLLAGAATAAEIATIPGATVPIAVNTVTVPWGDWLTLLLNWLRDLSLAVLPIIIAAYAPAPIKAFLTNNALQKATDYGFGIVEGAVKGKTLSVTQTNDVLRQAESYLIAQFPAVATKLGAMARAAILARVAAAGSAPETGTVALDVVPPPPAAVVTR
jgi:hypothetical protein